MTPERAQEIVTSINNRCMFTMDLGEADKLGSLRDVSLAEMLEATEMVRAKNKLAQSSPGPHTISCVPADRLIAAAYCMEHFPVDENEAILVMPMSRSEGFWHESNRKALAILPLKQSQNEDEDEEAA